MNTIHHSRFSNFPRRLPLVLPALLLAAGPFARGADAKDEPKTHTLFMGADFSIERGKEFYRVQDVTGGSFVIKVKGREVKVPTTGEALNLKVEQKIKLTETTLTVENLKGERAYTPARDPVRKFTASQSASAAQSAAATSAARMASAIQGANLNDSRPSGGPAGAVPGSSSADAVASRTSDFMAASSALGSDQNNDGYLAGKMQDELAQGLFDAMDVSFSVSSEKRLNNPYVVIVTQYREKGDKPDSARRWIYAKALDSVGPTPQKVYIKQGGFPPGFEMDRFQVHLYEGGEELASNVADKQVRLTREEAFVYNMIDYVGTHKGATLPAKPAVSLPRGETPHSLTPAQLGQTYYVKVSRDGLPLGAYVDELCSQPVDKVVGTLVENVRFYPALDKGKPVGGVAQVKLGSLGI